MVHLIVKENMDMDVDVDVDVDMDIDADIIDDSLLKRKRLRS